MFWRVVFVSRPWCALEISMRDGSALVRPSFVQAALYVCRLRPLPFCESVPPRLHTVVVRSTHVWRARSLFSRLHPPSRKSDDPVASHRSEMTREPHTDFPIPFSKWFGDRGEVRDMNPAHSAPAARTSIGKRGSHALREVCLKHSILIRVFVVPFLRCEGWPRTSPTIGYTAQGSRQQVQGVSQVMEGVMWCGNNCRGRLLSRPCSSTFNHVVNHRCLDRVVMPCHVPILLTSLRCYLRPSLRRGAALSCTQSWRGDGEGEGGTRTAREDARLPRGATFQHCPRASSGKTFSAGVSP